MELTSEEKPSLFDQIIAAAINHDEKILTELLEQGNLYYQDGYKPIKFLASHGNFHAIDFLIDKFRLDVNEVVFEYALSGYVEQVKELLIGKKVSKAKAILGYAISGNIEEVKKLLTHSSDKEDALLGFAMGGHEVWVNEMLSDGARIDVALRGYIKGGHTNRVKQLIVLGASKIQAVEEYYRNRFFPVSFLQLLAEFEDSEFRKLLIQKSNYGPYSIISAKENVTQRTHYKILGLADFAPFSAVESAYQRLLINAKEHPINPDIQEIYNTLITPHLRHNYDILLYKSKQDRVRWVMNFAVIAFAGISDYNFPNFTNSLYDLSSWIKRITEDFNAYYHKKLLNGYREYQYYLSSISNTDAEENLKDEIDILRKEIYHFAKLPFLLACMHDEADLLESPDFRYIFNEHYLFSKLHSGESPIAVATAFAAKKVLRRAFDFGLVTVSDIRESLCVAAALNNKEMFALILEEGQKASIIMQSINDLPYYNRDHDPFFWSIRTNFAYGIKTLLSIKINTKNFQNIRDNYTELAKRGNLAPDMIALVAASEESVAQKSAAAPITTKTPIKVGIPDSSQNINNTSKQLKGFRIKLFNSPSDETALTTRSTTRAKEAILPTSFNSPKPVKQKLPRASELDLLKFKTWYTPDYCEALIFSAYSRNILLPLAFSDTLNNREAFIWQVENAKLLCALVAKPLLFICKEPGSHNHFIAGILMNDKLLLLNPLGKTKHKDTRDILNEMVQKNILSSYKESANVLQQAHYEKTGSVSCGPLTVELIKNLLRNLTLNDLQKLFSDNAQEVDMGNWLAGQLTTNPFRTEASYKTYLLNIRQEHHQLYKNISDSAEVLNPPQQIIFNLLVTREETLISISNHPVYQQHFSKKASLDNTSAGIKLTTASQNPTVKERDRFFSHKPVIENDQRFKKGASQKMLYIAESYGYISDEVLSAYGFKPEQYRRAKKDIEHIVYIYANPEDAASDFNVEPNHNNPFEYVD